jgi:hypothetical protein
MEWSISLFQIFVPGQVDARGLMALVSTACKSPEGIDLLGFLVGPFTAAISIYAVLVTRKMTHLT